MSSASDNDNSKIQTARDSLGIYVTYLCVDVMQNIGVTDVSPCSKALVELPETIINNTLDFVLSSSILF